MMDCKDSLRLEIIEELPSYFQSKKKTCKRQISDLMKKYGYDEEFAENISNDFCLGFQTAKEIILKIVDEKGRENGCNSR